MLRGKVKWYDKKKGHGLILLNGKGEVFMHQFAIKGELPKQGDQVKFEIFQGRKGPEALDVRVVS